MLTIKFYRPNDCLMQMCVTIMNIEWWSRSNEKFTSQTIEGQPSVKQSIWALCIEYWIHWIAYQRYAFLVFDRLNAKMPNKLKYCEECHLLDGVARIQKTEHKIFVRRIYLMFDVNRISILHYSIPFDICWQEINRSSDAMVSSCTLFGIRLGHILVTWCIILVFSFDLQLWYHWLIYRTDIKLPQTSTFKWN